MRLLTVTLYEFGQFLQILLWISLPMAVIAVLITTYLHYRTKRVPGLSAALADEEERAGESWPEDGNHPYEGYLWIKEKYEAYRQQADDRYYLMKEEVAREQNRVRELNATIEEQGHTIADLSARLEANRRLLLNIHNDLNESLKGEGRSLPGQALPGEPALLHDGGNRIVGWVESATDPVIER